MSQTRREALVTIAALTAASSASAQTTFLSAEELTWVGVMVDIIIPRTDTPGASDTGVPAFIDRRLAGNARMAERFRAGMSALDAAATEKFGGAFLALTGPQRIVLLTARQDDNFFRMVKDLTVDGYYSSKPGLVEELGWHGNTFNAEFPGCTHPEHQS